ncbi:30S ribosomal protein S4 [Patescibacteria group bacterium]|nr:30S ribosomal protein S4 [Patescibacteria group bacterium]
MIFNAKCKKCRRAGEKLFLKGERCFGQKCAMIKRPYAPGVHGKNRRGRLSEYGRQLLEKQKIRYTYGLSEEQFKNYFKEIVHQKGNKEELFIQKLEKRLDNVVYRLGWAKSRSLARQIVNHGHILVNGKKTDIPSYRVAKGEVIKFKKKTTKSPLVKDLAESLKKHKVPQWLSLNVGKLEAEIKDEPKFEDFNKVGELNMVIEYYSR